MSCGEYNPCPSLLVHFTWWAPLHFLSNLQCSDQTMSISVCIVPALSDSVPQQPLLVLVVHLTLPTPFLDHVAWFLFCSLNIHPFLAISAFFFVKCQLTYTPVPLSWCITLTIYAFCLRTGQQLLTWLRYPYGDWVWQAEMCSLCRSVFLLLKNWTTCSSNVCSSSGGACSPCWSLAAALA